MEIIETLEEEDLGVKSKSLNLSKPVSSVGYYEVQMRLNKKHFINFKSTFKNCCYLSILIYLSPDLFQIYLFFSPIYSMIKY